MPLVFYMKNEIFPQRRKKYYRAQQAKGMRLWNKQKQKDSKSKNNLFRFTVKCVKGNTDYIGCR